MNPSTRRQPASASCILLGLARLGSWPVLVNARVSARELDEIRDHCGARRVLYTTAVSHHAREHAKRHNAPIVEVPDLGPLAVGALAAMSAPQLQAYRIDQASSVKTPYLIFALALMALGVAIALFKLPQGAVDLAQLSLRPL